MPERRAEHGRMMRKKWRDPEYRRRKTEAATLQMADPAQREVARGTMKRLRIRLRDDERLEAKRSRRAKASLTDPAYVAVQSEVMKDLLARPDIKRASRFRLIKMNRNPAIRKKQAAGRRRNAAARKENPDIPQGCR